MSDSQEAGESECVFCVRMMEGREEGRVGLGGLDLVGIVEEEGEEEGA